MLRRLGGQGRLRHTNVTAILFDLTMHCNAFIMAPMSRRGNERLAGVYRRMMKGHTCAYCGALANSKDHFVPVSVGAVFVALGIKFNRRTVSSCRECNSIAGALVFKTVGQKRRYVKQRIKEKYKAYLHCPDWSESELEDLGWTLRTIVERSLAIKFITKARLQSAPNVETHSSLDATGKGSARSSASVRFTVIKPNLQEQLGDLEASKLLDSLDI